jgi:hypothetical protein
MTDLFDTPEKKAAAIEAFVSLQAQPGWLLVTAIIEANIEALRRQIEDGVEDESKEDINRRRDLLKAYRNFINTPEMMIKKLGDVDPSEPDFDPYQTIEELRKERSDVNY